MKRFKREIAEDVFEENGNRNGMSSPVIEHEMMDTAVNGGNGNDLPRDGTYILKLICSAEIILLIPKCLQCKLTARL